MARDQLVEAALDLAWRHWGALGVRSVVHGAETAVDLEALIHFTLRLVDVDARLADEVRDWLEQYSHYISAPRLTALAKVFDTPPSALDALRTRPLNRKEFKSKLADLDTHARSLLRLRSIFGGNARADVLLHMLTSGESSVTALSLTSLGISKRTAAEVLEGLALGGLVAKRQVGNRLVYLLSDEDRLRSVLGNVPEGSGNWHLRLPFAARFIALSERVRAKEPVVQAVETRKLFEEFEAVVRDPEISKPPPTSAELYFERMSEWIATYVLAEPTFLNRAFGNLIEGTWFGPDGSREDGALLPRLDADQHHEFSCLDLVRSSVVGKKDDWIWTALSTVAEDQNGHSRGIKANESWQFVARDGRRFAARHSQNLMKGELLRLYGEEALRRSHSGYLQVQYLVTAAPAAGRSRSR